MGTTATTTTRFPFSLPPPKSYPPHNHHHFKLSILTPIITPTLRLQAMGAGDKLGEFGARDPFPAEIESGFAEKVLGNVNTEHKILIPTVSALSLSQQDCTPISPLQDPMSKDDAQKLLKKVLGWRLLDEEGGLKLQCLWKLRDFKCGVELVNRIYKATESCGHFPNVRLEQPNQVRAELWTASLGLTATGVLRWTERQCTRKADALTVTAKFELKPPPYPMDDLEPHMSKDTFEYHRGKHHRAYVDNLNKQIDGTERDDVVLVTYNKGGPLPAFNNPA
ncbi:hypothetical protein Peur_035212 [Populus x canadensis]